MSFRARGPLAALASLAVAAFSLPAVAQTSAPLTVEALSARMNPATPRDVTLACDAALEQAAQRRAQLEARKGPARAETDFRAFDDIRRALNAGSGPASIVAQTNTDAAKRDAARECQRRVSEAQTALYLSQPIYARLKAIDIARADPTTRHVLGRTLAEFERSGVAGGPTKAQRVAALQERISKATIAFSRNIADGRKTITAKPEELAGLPADYIARRKPEADGLVRITTDTPDLQPVMNYARSEDLRRRLYLANATRATQNEALLKELLAARAELAAELGRPTFAALSLEDKMTGAPAKAQAFLDEVGAITEAQAKADYARLLDRYRKEQPNAQVLPIWSSAYVQTQVRKDDYAVDPQEVRRYFAYDKVRDGIFRLTEDLFGVQIRRWDTSVWHESVEAFEMLEGGKVIGRFYLDNHPRPGKYTHAQVATPLFGQTGGPLPVAVMIANFPQGGHDTGLMEHGSVETFLHEFGHLLHAMFSGNTPYFATGFTRQEWDFIEAPSQMLENWVWDYDTLKTFAVNAEGRTIPQDLVARMNKGRSFAKAFNARVQLGLASASLGFHNGPAPSDLQQAYRSAYDRYALMRLPPEAHPYTAWTHMTGYSSYYYTYLWSETISDDLFTAFERTGLRDKATAARYRNLVLAPGASKPAAQLVQDFLGRPFNLEAYRQGLREAD